MQMLEMKKEEEEEEKRVHNSDCLTNEINSKTYMQSSLHTLN
jgi:hypothetical protein